MREIIFHGKRMDNDEWIEGSLLINGGDFYICPSVCDISYGDHGNRCRTGCWYLVKSETVGQYTGLTDKHGNRIFEGAIVARRRDISTIYLFVVKWDSECGMWALADFEEPEGDCIIDFAGLEACTFEVIGNIHDNQKLIKDGEQDAAG